jgi:hypothetical protein
MGVCDLVLTETPTFADGLGLAAHVRTKSRGDYSYIEAAAVKVGPFCTICTETSIIILSNPWHSRSEMMSLK